jgi:hypothetical protein
MAANTFKNEGKTEFVREVLGKNPFANPKAVNEAWKSAGKPGTVSVALVNKTRAALGLAGNLRAKRRKRNSRAGGEKARLAGKAHRRKGTNGRDESPRASAWETNGTHAEHASGHTSARSKAPVPRAALEELEADIDRLLFRVMAVGGLLTVEDKLRQARRLLYSAFSTRRR